MDWASLIEAVAVSRDRAAFKMLFEHFAPRIKAMMLRSGMANEQSEELAQESLIMLWRKAELFDRSRNGPSAWIYTIARNLRIDAIRRRSGMIEAAESELEFLADPALEPEAGLIAEDEQRRVRSALSALPPDQRELIRMSFFEGRPHGELAEQLRLPLGTVKSRIRLAMKKLRDVLDDQE